LWEQVPKTIFVLGWKGKPGANPARSRHCKRRAMPMQPLAEKAGKVGKKRWPLSQETCLFWQHCFYLREIGRCYEWKKQGILHPFFGISNSLSNVRNAFLFGEIN